MFLFYFTILRQVFYCCQTHRSPLSVRRRGSRDLSVRNNKKKQSPDRSLKDKMTPTPDILRVSRANTTCYTPDLAHVQKGRRRSQSPSSESMIHLKLKKGSLSSGTGTDTTDSPRHSDPDLQTFPADLSGHESPADTIGSTFYVRLQSLSEKGVFVRINRKHPFSESMKNKQEFCA